MQFKGKNCPSVPGLPVTCTFNQQLPEGSESKGSPLQESHLLHGITNHSDKLSSSIRKESWRCLAWSIKANKNLFFSKLKQILHQWSWWRHRIPQGGLWKWAKAGPAPGKGGSKPGSGLVSPPCDHLHRWQTKQQRMNSIYSPLGLKFRGAEATGTVEDPSSSAQQCTFPMAGRAEHWDVLQPQLLNFSIPK